MSDFTLPHGLPPDFDVIGALRRTRDRSVWRLRERESGGSLALKLVHPVADESARRGIAEEFLLLERIRHPHWVRPFDFVHLPDGSCGYTMEYLGGEEPRDIRSPGWGPRDLEALRAVLGALATLHAIGYVHLDLKPSQILCVPGRGAILIDPGLAAKSGTEVQPRGTWGFIAPEVLTRGAWDHRADLYSLGSMLVLIWTGENLLGEGEIAEQVRRQMKRPKLRLRDRIEELPDGMDFTVESLLDPDPGRRPPNAAQAWRAFHTIAGYRKAYLEQERVPAPNEIPFFPCADVETDWDRTLAGTGPERWVIEGPVGSGRRQLLGWLHARSRVSGATVASGRDRFDAITPNGVRFSCRLGRADAGEHVVSLGEVGEEAAAAALEAYGLPAEGEEAKWSRELLRLRLEERLGDESVHHRCARERRTVAAGMAGDLTLLEAKRLARLLAAVDEAEIPAATDADSRLLSRGIVRVGSDGRLAQASPPWDTDSLQVMAGEVELASAHRELLAGSRKDPLSVARHALAARDPESLRTAIAEAVSVLRTKGDVMGAHDLLVEAGEILGPSFTKESLPERLALVIEGGTTPGLELLNAMRTDLPGDWRILLDGHLAFRVSKYDEAIAAARILLETTDSPVLRSAATTMLIRAYQSSGRDEEALALGLPLVRSADPSRISETLPIAISLFNVVRRGAQNEEVLDELRSRLEVSLSGTHPRLTELASGTLAVESFERGEWARAKELLQMRISAAERLREPLGVASAKMNLAGISFVEGRLAECEALNREALLAPQLFGRPLLTASILRNIGIVLNHTGRIEESLDACRHARVIGENERDPRTNVSIRVHELTALAGVGLLRAGRQVFLELIGSATPLETLLSASVYFDMGQIARSEGRVNEARSLLEESLAFARTCEANDEIARSAFALSLLDMAGVSRHRSRELLDEGETAYQESSSSEIAPLREFTQAANHATTNHPERALENLRAGREIVRESGRLPWLWKFHAALAMLSARLGDSGMAFESLLAARLSLFQLLEAIHNDAMKESYVLLPDPSVFLAWCDKDLSVETVPFGSSDLLMFNG